MTPVAAVRPETRQQLDLLYAPIREELARVEQILKTELRSDYPYVDELVKHGFRLGGKRLRPALLLLAAQACGRVTKDHHVLAAVVEMIHTATLVHDDVLDEAAMRRHLETVNARWDNQASVLLGDFLFTHSFYLASTLETTYACQVIGRATNIVCEGELRQIDSRAKYSLTEAEYLGIIEAKTAELTACSCLLGAHYAGADKQLTAAMGRYGRALGIAFQIVDDLLDLEGDEATTGKSLGTDLEQQKPTLPLIRLLEQVSASEKPSILEILTRSGNHRREALQPWFTQCDALGYARTRAEEFATQARAEIAQLPESAAKMVVEGLTYFVVARQQ
ncbi:MAG: polyprenyl synthetase family protein [Planctomycetia bacterium]|nr:polyprenyl synthetase family protein [Planctomycetia bacterium]